MYLIIDYTSPHSFPTVDCSVYKKFITKLIARNNNIFQVNWIAPSLVFLGLFVQISKAAFIILQLCALEIC